MKKHLEVMSNKIDNVKEAVDGLITKIPQWVCNFKFQIHLIN
jgi:hypothetical protein